ncbi:MAG: hypothetical protein NVSMB19_18500 [Vulcanimicrobiaceae bacterium]
MAEGTLLVPNTTGGFPVDGVVIATAAAAVPAGSSFRQGAAIGDGGGSGNFAAVSASKDLLTSALSIGGPFIALPAGTTNGAVLTQGQTGVEITIQPGGSVTYTIASVAPTAAPTLFRTTANPVGASSALVDQINLASGSAAYITASTAPTTGTLCYRTI